MAGDWWNMKINPFNLHVWDNDIACVIVCVGKVQRLTKIVICYYNGPKHQWKGKPLFEMCRFHMDIARKGLSIYYVIRDRGGGVFPIYYNIT